MNNRLLTLFFLLLHLTGYSQSAGTEVKGNVSFISSENIYVSFPSTEGIQMGDTLFIQKDNKWMPILTVSNMSSISVVGKALKGVTLSLTNEVIAHKKSDLPLEVLTEKSNESVALVDQVIAKSKTEKKGTIEKKPLVDGRFSVSGYANFSDNLLSLSTPNYRLRYNLALNAKRIAGSGLSFESYLAYTHTLNNPTETFTDLKVYDLNLKYDFNRSTSLSLGRKINVNTANVGAVDGLQFEKRFKNITVGALVGFRPNDSTYGFDSKLFEYGAFISHSYSKEVVNMQSSLAFFNQTNNLNTDRCYLYVQHSNSLLKNVYFFGSAEIDLYSMENNVPITDFDMTSLYLSLSYYPENNLSLSLSYDTRKNVHYYETYKNRIDSLLENATRQGLRFRFNYRPLKYFSWSGTAGYRLQTPTSDESINAMSYLSYSRVPFIDASFTITGTYLKIGNESGFIYGGSLSKDFCKGNVDVELEYRKDLVFRQDIVDVSFSWRFTKNLMLSANVEGTIEQGTTFGRVFLNVTQRF